MSERPEPVEVALRALRARDRSTAELDERLRSRGVGQDERRETLATLERVGYLNEVRFAQERAATLAGRSSGDALIRDDLERRGVAATAVESALAALEPERIRAERVVARRGAGPTVARYLAARGFGEDAVAAVAARDGAGEVD